MRFTVWAPDARDVALHVDGRDVPAERGDGGGQHGGSAEHRSVGILGCRAAVC